MQQQSKVPSLVPSGRCRWLAAGPAGGAAGAAAGGAATAGTSGALVGAAPVALAAGVAIAAVGGAVALIQAGTHQRVIYIVITNPSDECFELVEHRRNDGHITCPKVIMPHSAVGVVLHHCGCLSGFLRYESREFCLQLGATNPFVGHNKLRIELLPRDKAPSLERVYQSTSRWYDLTGPLCCVADHYDNPSCASVILFQGEDVASAVKTSIENLSA